MKPDRVLLLVSEHTHSSHGEGTDYKELSPHAAVKARSQQRQRADS